MKVIIDGSNVAHYKKNKDSKPQLSNILAAVDALEKRGDEFVIIVDASLRHEIDEKDEFKKLLDSENVEQVPSGNNADHFIFELAEKEKAKILSNDKFRDFSDEFKDINSMRIPFGFDGSKITIGKNKKPKKNKRILQNICDEIIKQLEFKRWDVYTKKEELEISPLNIAKQAIIRIDNESNVDSKIESLFSKIPMFNKVMDMVDDVEVAAPYIIFVLVHPKDYKLAVKNAGNISVTVADRLKLEKKPLIAIRNDLFMKPGNFELNILLADEVSDNAPYNVEIRINTHDEVFIKKNSRNIASTIAGRLGSWKFPFVSVKPDMLLENPGDFEIVLEKGGKVDG
ncbi:Zc3h12a-like ribonuclease [Methanobrevibacter sp. OttesenSCG-928-K11]|nr:Zc3h12a-like ribonuclease [Methanobrevibacter sp. OttesenSCG-928-K11]MDL2270338.1 Zc3h12a-like ribonuclease [Methanobrevibacter sp. OttesenSCG-928-I08]